MEFVQETQKINENFYGGHKLNTTLEYLFIDSDLDDPSQDLFFEKEKNSLGQGDYPLSILKNEKLKVLDIDKNLKKKITK